MIPVEIAELYDEDWIEIGARIRLKRKEHGLAADDLAEYLCVGKERIYRIERGEASCTLQQIHLLHGYLNCSVEYLLYGDERAKITTEQQAAIANLKKALEALQIALSNVRRAVLHVCTVFQWQ